MTGKNSCSTTIANLICRSGVRIFIYSAVTCERSGDVLSILEPSCHDSDIAGKIQGSWEGHLYCQLDEI
ncbi:hypothetical protein RRF57_006332 [Xylaria bambusicola]|uniref:Uncharacterized protein n=1 Tax=Xylaria bambusicola TaxID=326684 RepID=A0AAN7Z5H6_9PEZI